jgi:hypothetical protein
MNTKKIIIMVLGSSNPHYKQFENAIRETWYNLKVDDVEIIFYSDNQSEHTRLDFPIRKGDNLILPCDDGYYHSGIKTVLAYDWLLKNYDFEYVYRSNLGAFVHPQRLQKFLVDKPKENFYCGVIGEDTYHLGFNVRFCSGSGYFLSKDVVEKVVQNHHMWQHRAVDDVALGNLLSQLNVPIDERAIRKNLCDGEVFYNLGNQKLESLSDDEIYHIRLRSEDRNVDIQNMYDIYNQLNLPENA